MKLRHISASERRRRKLGAAIEYELELDHLGIDFRSPTATVYLGPAQVMALQDAIVSSADVEREEVLGRLWIRLDQIVDELTELDGYGKGDQIVSGLRGEARGVALAIALLTSPRFPSLDWVREESSRRWDTRHR